MIENKHILLAEDDADFGSILKQYLEMSGFSVWARILRPRLQRTKAKSDVRLRSALIYFI